MKLYVSIFLDSVQVIPIREHIKQTLYERYLFDYIYVKSLKKTLLVVVAVPTGEATVERLSPTDKVSIPLKTNTMSVTEEPTTKEEINTIYIILGGFGILIVLFLFVLVLQIYTCKRLKPTRTNKVLKRNKCEDVGTSDASADDDNNENERTSKGIPRIRSKTKIQQPAESFYHDVEESLELRYSPGISNTSQEHEIHCHLPMSDLSYSPLSIKNSVLVQQMNDKQVKSIGGPSDDMKSDLYLHPITVLKDADGLAA